eukprot:SAG31_NODE_2126_length_6395_cov_3.289708_5_plen_803_part_00
MSSYERALKSPVAKIWWPSPLVSASSGYLVGWNIQGFSCCVAAVVAHCKIEDVESALEETAAKPELAHIRKQCQGSWMLLGEWSGGKRNSTFSNEISSSQHKMRRRSADLWIRMGLTRESEKPALREVYCCGVRYRPTYHIIFFDYVRDGHLLTCNASSFPKPLKDKHRMVERSSKSGKPRQVSNKGIGAIGGLSEIQVTLRQVNNCGPCAELTDIVASILWQNSACRQKDSELLPKPTLQAGTRQCKDSNNSGSSSLFATGLYVVVYVGMLAIRYMCEVVVPLIEMPLPCSRYLALIARRDRIDRSVVRLVDISATLHALDFKLRQFCFGSHDFNPGETAHQTACDDAVLRTMSDIRSRNFVYLARIDIIVGILFTALYFLQEQHIVEAVVRLEACSNFYYVEFTRTYVDWLIDEPAGFKLNKNLNRFIGTTFVDSIDVWQRLRALVANSTATTIVMKTLMLSGFAGFSCTIALASDILALSTLHIYWFYKTMGRAFRVHVRVLQSLALLFQGQKWNVLRHRADSCEYEIDQLLLGTLLFSLHFFLFPNVFGFYVFFILVWGHATIIQVMLSLVLITLNCFPIYMLFLRCARPGRVPAGIKVSVDHVRGAPMSPRVVNSVSAGLLSSGGRNSTSTVLSTGGSTNTTDGGDPAFNQKTNAFTSADNIQIPPSFADLPRRPESTSHMETANNQRRKLRDVDHQSPDAGTGGAATTQGVLNSPKHATVRAGSANTTDAAARSHLQESIDVAYGSGQTKRHSTPQTPLILPSSSSVASAVGVFFKIHTQPVSICTLMTDFFSACR